MKWSCKENYDLETRKTLNIQSNTWKKVHMALWVREKHAFYGGSNRVVIFSIRQGKPIINKGNQ
jgi:hypothetical protein